MEDLTVHLRGGQSITVRVRKCSYKRDPLTHQLSELSVTYPDPPTRAHQLPYINLAAVDAFDIRPVPDLR